MPDTQTRLSPDECGRLADDWFDRSIRQRLRPEDDGKYLAIDVTSGDFEIDRDDYSAVMRLRERRPAAEVWLRRTDDPCAEVLRSPR